MLKLIIVDDERGILDLIKYLIDYENIDVEVVGEAQDGWSAYNLILEKKPDVVITDIRMPGMTGLELIGKIKKTALKTSFIVISGYRDFEYAQDAMKFGVIEYLLKPIKEQELNRILTKLSNEKGLDISLKNKFEVIERQLAQNNDVLRKDMVWDFASKNPQRIQKATSVMLLDGIFDLHIGCFGAAIIKLDCPDRDENEISPMTMEAVVKKFVRRLKIECYDVEYVFDKLYGYILFHYSYDCENIKTQCSCLKELLKNDIYKHYFFDFTIGIGGAVSDLKSIHKAFSMAEQSLLTRIDIGLNEFIFYDDLLSHHKKIFSGLTVSEKEKLKKSIVNLNPDAMILLIDQFFVCYTENDCNYPLYGLCTELLILTNQEFTFNMKECILPPLQDYITTINNCIDRKSLRETCVEYVYTIFNSCIKQKSEMESKPIRIIKHYISEHYAESITLKDMADQVYLSPVYISSIFKKETGTTFVAYLIETRIEKAKELIKTTSLSINEIAEKVGYQNSKHFSKVFIKIVGMKPIVYRKFYA